MHDYLEFRIRCNGDHTYVASVRTDNYTGGDEEVWQAPLRPSRCAANPGALQARCGYVGDAGWFIYKR